MAIIPVILCLGCIVETGQPNIQMINGTLLVSELLSDPVYDEVVQVYGQVSELGELFCSCFGLKSGNESIMVWYDTMTEDNGTQRPGINVSEMSNADWVLISGELKTKGTYRNEKDFWMVESDDWSLKENEVIEIVEINESIDFCEMNFNVSPLDLKYLEFIMPLGLMVGDHVTPIDHQYWNPPDSLRFNDGIKSDVIYPVRAPASGILTEISEIEGSGYRFKIYHDCEIYSIFIVVFNMSERILSEAEFRNDGYSYSEIPVEAGEVIGYIKQHPFDFSVHDPRINLEGFVLPESYFREPWKIHTVDPFDYFIEPLASQLKELSLRSSEPIGGKIDYDIDGRLIGNWFLDGCDGYGCVEHGYWRGHLSIVYDYIDPSQIQISFGNFNNESRQFGVKDNSPNPADVSVEDGIVIYELVSSDYFLIEGGAWDRQSQAKLVSQNKEDMSYGSVSFQLIDNRTLRMEIFNNTFIYTR